MEWFRFHIADRMATLTNPSGPPPPAPVRQFPKDFSDRELLEWIIAQLGDGDPTWQSKGMTLRDKVWTLGKDA